MKRKEEKLILTELDIRARYPQVVSQEEFDAMVTIHSLAGTCIDVYSDLARFIVFKSLELHDFHSAIQIAYDIPNAHFPGILNLLNMNIGGAPSAVWSRSALKYNNCRHESGKLVLLHTIQLEGSLTKFEPHDILPE